MRLYPEIAVMILNYNGYRYIDNCLSSLYSDKYINKNIYFLDNNSTDRSLELIKSKYPKVNIISYNKNYGYAYSYDNAIRAINEKYVAVLNNDTCVHEDWLIELYKAIIEDDNIAICGSKLISYYNNIIIEHAGGLINPIGGGIDIGRGQVDKKEYSKKKYVGFACGGGALIDKNIYHSIGGFDNKFFLYHEDVDICWRSWLSGYKVLYVPTSIVYHYGGGTAGKIESPFRIYHSQKSRLRCLLKNSEFKGIIKGLIATFIFDLYRIIKYAFKFEIKSIIALIRANISSIKLIKYIIKYKKRKSIKIIQNELKCKIVCSMKESIKEYRNI